MRAGCGALVGRLDWPCWPASAPWRATVS